MTAHTPSLCKDVSLKKLQILKNMPMKENYKTRPNITDKTSKDMQLYERNDDLRVNFSKGACCVYTLLIDFSSGCVIGVVHLKPYQW